jgi:[protein-PII] uridylyltransferase
MEEFAFSHKEKLDPPDLLPDGHFHENQFVNTKRVCRELGEQYLSYFQSHPSFLKAHPVLLGSWERQELCPKSDLDIGFWGPEQEVQKFVSEIQSSGMKIRSRLLSHSAILEWPRLEQLSLLKAKALTEFGKEQLLLWKKPSARELREIYRLMEQDRKSRMRTFSIENVLEPHLKTGAGGLRDVLHFDQVRALHPDLEVEEHVLNVIEHCRWFLLTIRYKLHELGGQDYLQADLQIELAKWFGYSDFRSLMKQVQMSLSRVLFYSEWIQKQASASSKKRLQLQKIHFKNPEEVQKFLEKNSDILSIYQIRKVMDDLLTPTWIKKNPKKVSEWMNSTFSWKSSEEVLRAFFRSRLADQLDPRLRKIVGYNQHDQYHAYTADAHILNLLIEFKTLIQKPQKAHGFRKIIAELKEVDRSILSWTCYYHDLGKGQSGAHEEIGSEYVLQDHQRFRRSKSWTQEVDWLVKNHLEFSKAAFRGDPNDDQALARLYELDLTPERVRRLMVFTVLDIRATHPKAWTPWKEQLLLSLYRKLMDPERGVEVQRTIELQKKYPQLHWTPGFLNAVPFSALKMDLAKVKRSKPEENFEFFKGSGRAQKGFLWVRYFNPDNQKGILLQALRALFSLGCSVQQAYVLSLPFGAYDWFLVESPSGIEALRKRVSHLSSGSASTRVQARWNRISMLSTTEQSWTLLLQGKDARGLLMHTIEVMVELGAEIKSARAQTWGRQVEDVVEMTPALEAPDLWLSKLAAKIERPENS